MTERIVGDVWTEKIGEINIESGSCLISDPCNVIHSKKKYKELGKDWHEFANMLCDGSPLKQLNFDNGISGLGVCVPAGFGDGLYEVFAEIVQTDGGKHVKSVKVIFIPDEEVERMKKNS